MYYFSMVRILSNLHRVNTSLLLKHASELIEESVLGRSRKDPGRPSLYYFSMVLTFPNRHRANTSLILSVRTHGGICWGDVR
jgi:hypothetical protein